jgi:hypothetical protein
VNAILIQERQKFGVPEWMACDCPYCKKKMPSTSVLAFGVDLSPSLFGNLGITYVCPHCDSLCEMHYESAFKAMPDLGFSPVADVAPVPREEIVKRGAPKIGFR